MEKYLKKDVEREILKNDKKKIVLIAKRNEAELELEYNKYLNEDDEEAGNIFLMKEEELMDHEMIEGNSNDFIKSRAKRTVIKSLEDPDENELEINDLKDIKGLMNVRSTKSKSKNNEEDLYNLHSEFNDEKLKSIGINLKSLESKKDDTRNDSNSNQITNNKNYFVINDLDTIPETKRSEEKNYSTNKRNDLNFVSNNSINTSNINKKTETYTMINPGNNLLTLSKEEDFTTNYINYENIYLNEGKIKNRVEEINMFKSTEDIHNKINPNKTTHNNNINISDTKQNALVNSSSFTTNSFNLPCEYNKNEFKLRILQEKIEFKIRSEYEDKIKYREKEIEFQAKKEFESAMDVLKLELEKNLEEEKKKMEEELQTKWMEKYEDLLVECKSKLRDDREQKLAMNMYNKIKPVVEKQIYKNEYSKVEEKIRKDLEGKLNQDIQTKKNEEVEKVKKRLEHFTKVKLEEIESTVKSKCKEEVENEMKTDLERKEKEMKINYLRKFENFKNCLEKQLKDEYEVKKKELSKEVSEIKSKVYRQKCAEKLKLNKINKIKKTLEAKEKVQLENAEILEKVITVNSLMKKTQSSKSNLDMKAKIHSISPDERCNKKSHLYVEEDYNLDFADDGNYSAVREGVNNNEDYMLKKDAGETIYSNPQSPKSNAVNLRELNKRLKVYSTNSTTGNHTGINIKMNNNNTVLLSQHERKDISLIMNEKEKANIISLNTTNLKESLNNLIMQNSKLKVNDNEEDRMRMTSMSNFNSVNNNLNLVNNTNNQHTHTIACINSNSNFNTNSNLHAFANSNTMNANYHCNFRATNTEAYKLDSPKRLKQEESKTKPTSKTPFVSCNSPIIHNNPLINRDTSILNSLAHQSVSLRLNGTAPSNLIEFGTFLVKYIENEENYRILFERELKKLKLKIIKNFDDEKLSDHCLLDYMIELWDKLEISYCIRYQILSEISKR